MKILTAHPDGSKTVQYEPGDRVIFIRDSGSWLGGKKGEKATVIRGARPDEKYPSIAFLDLQTDSMKEGNWGTITVAPWEIELLPEENA